MHTHTPTCTHTHVHTHMHTRVWREIYGFPPLNKSLYMYSEIRMPLGPSGVGTYAHTHTLYTYTHSPLYTLQAVAVVGLVLMFVAFLSGPGG